MANKIFFLNEADGPIALQETQFENEKAIQVLIAKHPEILALDQITPDEPNKWIFIGREIGVPSQEDGGDLWSLDHLFIDPNCIPTLVEVKRSTNTQIRRMVVAQMLDYAANGSRYWPISRIREIYESRFQDGEQHPLEEIGIAPEDQDQYWESVANNLSLGKLRLLFVADEIPNSLQNIIEFLNKNMPNIEVLAVEIRRYKSQGGHSLLVPHLIGKSTEAEQIKNQEITPWDKDSFVREIQQRYADQTADYTNPRAELIGKLLTWAKKKSCRVSWGSGQIQPGFVVNWCGEEKFSLFTIYIYKSHIALELPLLRKDCSPFDNREHRELRDEMITRLKKSGFDIPDEKRNSYCANDISFLLVPSNYTGFTKTMNWMIEEIKKYEQAESIGTPEETEAP